MQARKPRRRLPPAEDAPRSPQGIPYRYKLKTPPRPARLPSASQLARVRAALRYESQRALFDVLVEQPGITLYDLSLALGMDGSMPSIRVSRFRKALQRHGLTINRPTGGVYFGGDRDAGSRIWIEEWHDEQYD